MWSPAWTARSLVKLRRALRRRWATPRWILPVILMDEDYKVPQRLRARLIFSHQSWSQRWLRHLLGHLLDNLGAVPAAYLTKMATGHLADQVAP